MTEEQDILYGIERDARVTRETVGLLQTLAIKEHERIAEIERHVRDIKYGVFLLLGAVAALAYRLFFQA